MPSAQAEPTPAYDWHPKRFSSAGREAVELAALAGLHLDPWQRLAVDRILSEDERGMPAAFEAAVLIARQNGKGSILECLELYWLLVEQVELVMHSAHEFKTAAEGFRRVVSLLRGSEELSSQVSRVLTGAGSEAIEFVDGQRLRFVARSKGSGRGFSADKVILDEAYALSEDEMAALLPTLATREAAQVVYTSSAAMADSHVLHRIVRRGRRLSDPSLAYVEFRAPGAMADPGCDRGAKCPHVDVDGCALDRVDFWEMSNPGRVGVDFIGKERRALSPEKFARERLGWEDEEIGAGGGVFSEADWESVRDPHTKRAGPPVLSADVSPDRKRSAISFAALNADGVPMARVIRHGEGSSWVVDHLLAQAREKRASAIVVDEVGPISSFIDDIRAGAPCTVHVMNAGEVADAYADLHDAVTDTKRVRHTGESTLDAAVRVASTRTISGGRTALDRIKSEADITALVSAEYALWGLSRYGAPDQIVY